MDYECIDLFYINCTFEYAGGLSNAPSNTSYFCIVGNTTYYCCIYFVDNECHCCSSIHTSWCLPWIWLRVCFAFDEGKTAIAASYFLQKRWLHWAAKHNVKPSYSNRNILSCQPIICFNCITLSILLVKQVIDILTADRYQLLLALADCVRSFHRLNITWVYLKYTKVLIRI